MSSRWGRPAGTATAVFASALVWPLSARAEGSSIRLEYDAPESCPSRDAFVAALRARARPFELAVAAPEAMTYRVTLRSGDGSTGRVASRESSGAPIVQELHGAGCGEVSDALALVVALAIDGRTADASAVTAAPPRRALASSPASAPVEVAADPPVGLGAHVSRWTISSTVGVGVNGPFVGPEAFVEMSRVRAAGDHGISFLLDARLGASFGWSAAGDSFGDVAQFTRASALLDVCPLRVATGRLAASACARGEAGAISGSGGSIQSMRPSVAGGALVVAQWTLWRPVFVQLGAGAVVPFLHDRFLLDGIAVYTVSPVDALGSLAVGARFR